jgi:hypothetical protein
MIVLRANEPPFLLSGRFVRVAIFGNARQKRSQGQRAVRLEVSPEMRAIVVLVLLAGSVAHADDHPGRITTSTADDRPGHDLFYAELLGKAGEYGLGYEHGITSRLALGVAASFAVVRGQQLATAAPYVHATIAARHAHALFGELGAVLVHSRIPSPVPDWSGMSDTGGGGFASLGYEHGSRHVVVRIAASVVAGEGGVAPALGFAIGVRP